MRVALAGGFMAACIGTTALLFTADAQSRTLSYSERLIRNAHAHITATQNCQRKMSRHVTSVGHHYRFASLPRRRYVIRKWKRKNEACWEDYRSQPMLGLPPHYQQWMCIHRYEGSWTDTGDPYWGGLQMDRNFMQAYAPAHLLRRGFAHTWTPLEQMWVAENAYRTRGFGPWPNTARFCGLL